MNLTMPGIYLSMIVLFSCAGNRMDKIDRHALVNRHNIVVEKFDTLATLSAGNGNFAFTTDFTGLQTFFREYENGVSLGTQSNWGWHTMPNTGGYEIQETWNHYEVEGRQVPYRDQLRTSTRATEAVNYFRENPHRLHLGLIRLLIYKENGEEVNIDDIQQPRHRLDLWKGEISSDFMVEGVPVSVLVYVHQEKDMVAARISSPLINLGRLSVELLFPYGKAVHTHPGYDLDQPAKHISTLVSTGGKNALISRKLDNDSYYASLEWSQDAQITEADKHRFQLKPSTDNSILEFSCLFSANQNNTSIPDFEATMHNNEIHWERFWKSGGAVDFSDCTDPRAEELERRTILSQYLTKIQGSGNLPPQETGLTFNSWFGKFHLEMIWWHSAHFYNWQRTGYMAGQLQYYHDIYPRALETAGLQGYEGVRWPKMVGPDGQDSPSSVGTYLIWQQPHFIYLVEQLYRSDPSVEILNEYAGLVFATAEFMADFPVYDPDSDEYNLMPPLIPAQEHWNRETTVNPPFELAYWYWGLTTALKWKERMGQKPVPKWEEVRSKLPGPFEVDGLYMGTGNASDSYTETSNMRDHPMVLGTLGMLPEWEKLDNETMRSTLRLIMERWDWQRTWGWDYPMVAMCATRLLEPEIAIESLLKDVQKNTYLVNGHNYQDQRLRIYMPGNGGFLKAIALMCAGWEGCDVKNPGFPDDGKWNVRWENLTQDF
jgi:hypothetical protein